MFPTELTLYNQWVCWRYELEEGKDKPTKRPYSARTGMYASVNDPNTWTDYATACYAASNGCGYNGIGFVLTANDPYLFIDLDDPEGNPAIIEKQKQIVEAFDTYSELSPSGKGLHLIAKGAVFGGRKRNKIEIYSSEHYFTMTGQTYHNKPIAERNQLASLLWEELGSNGGGANIDLKVISQPELHTDEIIFNVASQADNGNKFLDLWNGYWPKYYKSQSEADFAMINMLGFYSRNVNQIRRMFLSCQLGRRDKAMRKSYVDTMIKRSFDNLPPLIPIEEALVQMAKELEAKRSTANVVNLDTKINPWNQDTLFANMPDPDYDWTRPPGLLGEISQFIYDAAPRPVKEIALGAAIALMAGICGRVYNVSNTGLNQYILLLAKTGIGKEAAASGIDKLINHVRLQVPGVGEYIGPADIVSGQALIKHVSKHPCFVSIVGEFGLMLQIMHSAGANPSQVQLKRKMLDLYTKSGADQVLRETIYSDKNNNTEPVRAPNFTLLGESTPETFYRGVDENIITEGLLPRFTCIEYLGDRPDANDSAINVVPPKSLIDGLCNLTAGCLMLTKHETFVNVAFNDESEKMHKQYRNNCDAQIRSSNQMVTRELWSRAHLKILKLAALIAVGQNMHKPLITCEALEWARVLIERDIVNILSKFESGKAGKETGELNQINELVNCISYYIRKNFVNLKAYKVDERMHQDGIIPHAYLSKRLLGVGAFKTDRMGATFALTKAIRALMDEGCIREVRAADMFTKYSTTAKAYYAVDITRF